MVLILEFDYNASACSLSNQRNRYERILILSLLGALLGGCVIVPLGYGYRGDGYYRGAVTIVGTATGGMATGITAANERSQ